MKINDHGLQIIKGFEALRLQPYQCSSGVHTIGFGHAILSNGRMLRGTKDAQIARDLFPHGITPDIADEMLAADLATAERAVADLVALPLTEDEFSALVSLTFNVGRHNFMISAIRGALTAGDKAAAAKNFKWWRSSGGKQSRGLTRRRAAEKALFLCDYVSMNRFLASADDETIAAAAEYLGVDIPLPYQANSPSDFLAKSLK